MSNQMERLQNDSGGGGHNRSSNEHNRSSNEHRDREDHRSNREASREKEYHSSSREAHHSSSNRDGHHSSSSNRDGHHSSTSNRHAERAKTSCSAPAQSRSPSAHRSRSVSAALRQAGSPASLLSSDPSGSGLTIGPNAWLKRKLHLRPQHRGVHLVTEEILAGLPELAQFQVGIMHIQLLHTSASLTINENWDPDVRDDMEMMLNRLVPEQIPFKHSCEGPDDMPAHAKVVIFHIFHALFPPPGLPSWFQPHPSHLRRSSDSRHLAGGVALRAQGPCGSKEGPRHRQWSYQGSNQDPAVTSLAHDRGLCQRLLPIPAHHESVVSGERGQPSPAQSGNGSRLGSKSRFHPEIGVGGGPRTAFHTERPPTTILLFFYDNYHYYYYYYSTTTTSTF